jgi:hypothetical protein
MGFSYLPPLTAAEWPTWSKFTSKPEKRAGARSFGFYFYSSVRQWLDGDGPIGDQMVDERSGAA